MAQCDRTSFLNVAHSCVMDASSFVVVLARLVVALLVPMAASVSVRFIAIASAFRSSAHATETLPAVPKAPSSSETEGCHKHIRVPAADAPVPRDRGRRVPCAAPLGGTEGGGVLGAAGDIRGGPRKCSASSRLRAKGTYRAVRGSF